MERGLLICVEGTDASGKATQADLLVKRMIGKAVLYSFPRYGTALGQMILRHLKSETLLADGITLDGKLHAAPEDPLWFQCACLADKYEAVSDIESHLAHGMNVICDRWKPSGIAFGAADGVDVNWLDRAQERLPTADLNIFLSVSEEEALRRRPKLRDRYELDREKQKIIALNYNRMWSDRVTDMTEPKLWCIVDGEGPVDVVHARIWEQVMNAEAATRVLL